MKLKRKLVGRKERLKKRERTGNDREKEDDWSREILKRKRRK